MPNKRGARRVPFARPFTANIMAIDGTWRRGCTVKDVSDTGARLIVDASDHGLPLKEFFLVLSATGLAYRRCEVAWVNGAEVGVTFLKQANLRLNRASVPH
ncbi:PilZ domain-containing protein [Bradyrhizobium guangdongense]|uniref:PilZ domain-containing protein n=1 Tax=Bradyrhizobium guangdongense TaxID=1325090 RepID=A0ABX6US48_9BRAD|nr:PilZ domain-containing protein [Bradyrhizobium guangdongense]QAU42653.1 PilZ domain-containing protein [Bradyrhizobium guangdongense]QOZ63708.1 PilZ domain-containing protein [Bradyrhizobium guangdongense]